MLWRGQPTRLLHDPGCRQERFVCIPCLDFTRLARSLCAARITFFQRSLISRWLTRSMLGWAHRGIGVESSAKIRAPSYGAQRHLPADLTQQDGRGRECSSRAVLLKTLPPSEFLIRFLEHLPDARIHPWRFCGLCSSAGWQLVSSRQRNSVDIHGPHRRARWRAGVRVSERLMGSGRRSLGPPKSPAGAIPGGKPALHPLPCVQETDLPIGVTSMTDGDDIHNLLRIVEA